MALRETSGAFMGLKFCLHGEIYTVEVLVRAGEMARCIYE